MFAIIKSIAMLLSAISLVVCVCYFAQREIVTAIAAYSATTRQCGLRNTVKQGSVVTDGPQS